MTYWTRERILDAIQAWAVEYGEPPRAQEWQRGTPDYPARTTVCAMFGTWNAAIRAAGYPARDCKGWTPWDKDRVAAAFLDFLMREGRWPTSRDCMWRDRKPGMPDWRTVYHHFGSWPAAKRYAGWDPAPAPVTVRVCAGCGCDLDSRSAGCTPCSDRHRNRLRWQDPDYRAAQAARRRLRLEKIAPGRLSQTASPRAMSVDVGASSARGEHVKEAA